MSLPFETLLADLQRRGFVIGVDHHLRLQALLNQLGSDCVPEELAFLLAPVFATNEKQQAQFHEAFQFYLPLMHAEGKKNQNKPVEPPLGEPQNRRRPYRWPYVLIVAVLCMVVFVRTDRTWHPKPPEVESTMAEVAEPLAGFENTPDMEPKLREVSFSKIKGYVAQINQAETSDSRPQSRLAAFYHSHRQALRMVFLLAPLLWLVFLEWYRYRRRKLVLDHQQGSKPPLTWPLRLPVPDLPIVRNEAFYTTARRLRERLPGEITRLDIPATLEATIRTAGFPQYRTRRLTRQPEYLALIDRTWASNHHGRMAGTLVEALVNEGLFVHTWYYETDPRICFRDNKRVQLAALHDHHPHCRLLIFGDGEGLVDAITGEPEPWLPLLTAWSDRAILTPKPPARWGHTELTLAVAHILLPASLTGLGALVDRFEKPNSGNPARWRNRDFKRPSPPHPADDPGLLREYLGPDGFQWLCACAVYPELHWDLTLYLGTLSFMPPGLLNEENLVRLIRLPWFREGSLPDELRWRLVEALDIDLAAGVRAALVHLMENDPPPKESLAYDTWQMNLVIQKWLLNRSDRKKRKAVAVRLETHRAAMDYTVIRFLETAPAGPLSLLLPQRLHRLFFRNGIAVFGLRSAMRGLMTAVVVALLWLVMPSTMSVALVPELIPLTGGKFQMGSEPGEPGSFRSEYPKHQVNLEPFAMGKYEVTSAQYARFLNAWGNQEEGGSSWLLTGQDFDFINQNDQGHFVADPRFVNHPVSGVSWYGARAYCRWLSAETGVPFRLPTEAEWEYACRAGTTTQYYFGENVEKVPAYGEVKENAGFGPVGIGRKRPNPYGLHDMLGNMFEWCLDGWRDDYRQSSDRGIAPVMDKHGLFVVRGGSWYDPAFRARSANRYNFVPVLKINLSVGFRVVASPLDGYGGLIKY